MVVEGATVVTVVVEIVVSRTPVSAVSPHGARDQQLYLVPTRGYGITIVWGDGASLRSARRCQFLSAAQLTPPPPERGARSTAKAIHREPISGS
jgi:hypothetical protein